MQSPGSLDIIPARSCPSEKRSLNEKGLLSSGGGFSTDWSQAAPQDTESNAKVQCFPGISVVKNQPASARGHGFNPWSGKISQAAEQLSPCSTTIERELQSLGTSSTEPRLQLLKPVCPRAHHDGKSTHQNKGETPSPQLQNRPHSRKNPAGPKINKQTNADSRVYTQSSNSTYTQEK